LKFTHRGHVKVSARPEPLLEMLAIDVEDTGIGIAAENVDRIFQPFDQEDQSESRSYDGLGLGLAICHEVATKHGGSLWVTSEQGQGSTFHVRLPYRMPVAPDEDLPVFQLGSEQGLLSETADGAVQSIPIPDDEEVDSVERGSLEAAEQIDSRGLLRMDDEDTHGETVPELREASMTKTPEIKAGDLKARQGNEEPGILSCDSLDLTLDNSQPEPGTVGASEHPTTILYLGDDKGNQEITQTLLQRCGFHVMFATTPSECYQLMEDPSQALPDLILLELTLPGVSGLDVVSRLRQKHSSIMLPIVKISAKNTTAAVVKGLELGCNDWVHRPYDRVELVARMNCQLTLKHSLRTRDDRFIASFAALVPRAILDQIAALFLRSEKAKPEQLARMQEQMRVFYAQSVPKETASSAQLDQDRKALSIHAEHAKKAQAEAKELQTALRKAEQRLAQSEGHLETLERQRVDMGRQNAELQQARSSLQLTRTDLEKQRELVAQYEEKLSKYDELKRKQRELSAQHKEKLAEHEEVKRQQGELAVRLREKTAEYEELEKQHTALKESMTKQSQAELYHRPALHPPLPQDLQAQCSQSYLQPYMQHSYAQPLQQPQQPLQAHRTANRRGRQQRQHLDASQVPPDIPAEQASSLLLSLQHENAHLHVDLRSREDSLLSEQSRSENLSSLLQLANMRCIELESTVQRLQVDAEFFGWAARSREFSLKAQRLRDGVGASQHLM